MDHEQDWITDFIVFALTWPTPESWDDEMRAEFKHRIKTFFTEELHEAYPIVDIFEINE